MISDRARLDLIEMRLDRIETAVKGHCGVLYIIASTLEKLTEIKENNGCDNCGSM